ncbi:MAG TPA: elongation factor G [Bacteroidales bacterium]|nr:elongation factor G [Bacteroidales bacterium]
MKSYVTNQIRNIALLGSSGSGKTTLAEAMLFESGVIERKGSVEQKNTVSDYNEIEHNNKASVFSSVMYAEVNDRKLNILDNPGMDDFIGATLTSLHVADSAVVVINAHNGVEVGTEIHARHLKRLNKPMILLFNQMDHEKASYEKTLEAARERLGKNITVVQYPVNEGTAFDTIIDVILMKMLKYPKEGGKPEITEIPAAEAARAAEYHNALVEKAAENDDKLMELFFEKGTLEVEDLRSGLRLGVLKRDVFPVFVCSAKKSIGIGRFMEFLGNVAPSPEKVEGLKTTNGNEIKVSPDGAPSLFVFKTSIEPHIGEVSYFKVITGKVTEAIDLNNNNNQGKERLTQLYVCSGKNRTKVTELIAGDIGATVKLKNTKTGHTLAGGSFSEMFEKTTFPEPKFRIAIKAKVEAEEEKLGEILIKLRMEDPTILIEHSKELKQTIISGQGEYHISTLKWHLDHIHKIDVEFMSPKIPYRETITKVAAADYRHKKQSGGAGQFGEVHLVIEPYVEGAPDPVVYKVAGKEIKLNIRDKQEVALAWGGKLVFYNCIVGGAIDARFLPAIMKGIMEKMEEGPLTGSYARDIRVAVYDGKMHPVDSNEISFKLAGRNAFKEAFKNAGPKILEPVYDVEVLVPSERMGDVMSDLQTRRAVVLGMSSDSGFEKISARVPLAEMDKYSTSLSSLTQGRAIYNMKFAEYAPTPAEVQNELLKAYEAAEVEE